MDLKNFHAYQIIRGLKFVYDLFLLVSLYYQKMLCYDCNLYFNRQKY